jgi:MSHA type pilus biogenesis protein MshL
MRPALTITVLTLAVGGCALQAPEIVDTQALRSAVIPTPTPRPSEPLDINTRLSFPSESQSVLPAQASETLYTFQAAELPISQALRLFAEAFSLNLIVDEEVSGVIDVDFSDLPFEDAMSTLLDAHGYYWTRDRNLIHVRSQETRLFEIDYIRLVRTGNGSSQAQVSSTSSGGGSGSAAGGSAGTDSPAGTMSIQQTDSVSFWGELENELAVLVSEEGRLVVNRLAGTIQVSDQHRRVEEIAAYLQQVEQSIYRQVDIEIKIVEVTLNDDLSLGIDWSRLVSPGAIGDSVDYVISNVVGAPAGGIGALSPSLNLTYSNTAANGSNDLTGMLSALSEQGDVQVVSQPHIRTLNNQSALIKVGTDRTFFRKEQVTDATNAGSQTFSTDVPQVVTEGIVLSITPQISMQGWITMDVSPVVTRVSSVSEVLDDNGNVQSTAPNLDISQASSLVRARSGQTIIIGGLIQNADSYTSRGVPGLRRIPGIGQLFTGTYKAETKKELIMFLTPRLVDREPPGFAVNSR